MKAPPFEYVRPDRLETAINFLAENGDEAKVIAGGQSLVPMLAFRLSAPRFLVDIGRIPKLRGVTIDDDGIRLGALTRWREIEQNDELRSAHPLLVEAVRHVAHYQIRNRGTIGGSLAHADPAAELPGIAVTCDGTVVLLGPTGRREVPADGFFTGPLTTTLRPDELILELRLPALRKDFTLGIPGVCPAQRRLCTRRRRRLLRVEEWPGGQRARRGDRSCQHAGAFAGRGGRAQ